MILGMQYDFEKGRTFLYPFSNYDIISVRCRGKQFSSATQFTTGGGVYGDTQQEVADILGVTKSTISKYEKGLRGINSSHLEKLSELYKTEPIFILTGKTSKEWQDRIEKESGQAQEEERAYWESILLSNAVRSITPLLDKLNDEGQKKAVERVEELTEIPKYQRTENQPETTQEATEDKK